MIILSLTSYLLFKIQLPGLGMYRGTWLPNTDIKADKDDAFCGSGINIAPVEPMRSWSLDFDGPVRKVTNDGNGEVSKLISNDNRILIIHDFRDITEGAKGVMCLRYQF